MPRSGILLGHFRRCISPLWRYNIVHSHFSKAFFMTAAVFLLFLSASRNPMVRSVEATECLPEPSPISLHRFEKEISQRQNGRVSGSDATAAGDLHARRAGEAPVHGQRKWGRGGWSSSCPGTGACCSPKEVPYAPRTGLMSDNIFTDRPLSPFFFLFVFYSFC